MHLPQRRGSEWLGIEALIQLLWRRAQLRGDHLACLLDREWADVTLEACQFALPLFGQSVRAAGDDLAQLHVRRTELLKHQPDLLGRAQRLDVDTVEPAL